MSVPAIAVLGTASDVGKSAIAGALCRILSDRGLVVAPFKAQNMSNNAAVCADGGEIGRAQAMQARAARRAPLVEMNPILLKPEQDARSQVVVLGRPVGTEGARQYLASTTERFSLVTGAYDRLTADADVAVIEGAGGAAEINLWDRDLVNWRMAEYAQARVVLVGDIGRGGVFAQLLGTLELLPPAWRQRVAGLIVNNFRGDASLFDDGRQMLEQRAGVPVLGIVPWLPDLLLETEDGTSLRPEASDSVRPLYIAVVRLPRLSNFTDFERLAAEPDVSLRYVTQAEDVVHADVVIVPGTKSTLADLEALRARGFDSALRAAADRGAEIVGLCGGMQLLGQAVSDPDQVEGGGEARGLGLLPVETVMVRDKTTRNVSGTATWGRLSGLPVSGYEIHVGQTRRMGGEPAFMLDGVADGVVARQGLCWGTYLHGVFDTAEFRRRWLNELRRRKGLAGLPAVASEAIDDAAEQAVARFASHVANYVALEPLLTGFP